MWEAQSDWYQMPSFWVRIGEKKYNISKTEDGYSSNDKTIQIESDQNSFTINSKEGICTFIPPFRTIKTHQGRGVNCLFVTPNGEEILSGDSTGKLFNQYRDTEPVPMEGPMEGFDIEDCFIDLDTKKMYSCGGDFTIYCFGSDYFVHNRLTGHKASVKRILKIGDFIYSGSEDGTVRSWDINTYKHVATADLGSPVTDICFNDQCIYVSTDRSIKALDIRTNRAVPSPDNGETTGFMTLDVNKETNQLCAGNDEGVISVWDTRNLGKPLLEWNWYDSMVNKVRYHNNNLWVATNDGTAAAINPEEKKSLIVLGTPSYEAVKAIAFSNSNVYTAGAPGIINGFKL